MTDLRHPIASIKGALELDRQFVASRRLRRVIVIGLSGGAANAVTALISLITVPLALSYLGAELYGVWVTVSAVVVTLALAEFGITSSLVNVVSSAAPDSPADRERVRAAISGAFFSLGAILGVVLCVFMLLSPLIDWDIVFNVGQHVQAARLEIAVPILVVCFLGALLLGIADQINAGLQEAYHNAVWRIVGAATGLAGLATAVALEASLPWLVLSISGGLLFGRAGNFAGLFFVRKRWMRPSFSALDPAATRSVIQVGGLFFGLQAMQIISHQSDYWILAQILGPAAVTEYSIALKLFMVPTSFIVLFLKPLWPAYGEAAARGDMQWLRRAFTRALGVSLALTIPAAATLYLVGGWIVSVWLGEQLTLSSALIAGMACFIVISVIESNLTKLYYAVNAMGVHLRWSIVMTAVNVVISVYLTMKIGVAGAIIGSVIARALFTVVPLLLMLSWALGRAEAMSSAARFPAATNDRPVSSQA